MIDYTENDRIVYCDDSIDGDPKLLGKTAIAVFMDDDNLVTVRWDDPIVRGDYEDTYFTKRFKKVKEETNIDTTIDKILSVREEMQMFVDAYRKMEEENKQFKSDDKFWFNKCMKIAQEKDALKEEYLKCIADFTNEKDSLKLKFDEACKHSDEWFKKYQKAMQMVVDTVVTEKYKELEKENKQLKDHNTKLEASVNMYKELKSTQNGIKALGCVDDILVIITSCLRNNASYDAQTQAKSILELILRSGIKVNKPTWYRFDWEEDLWKKYGELE
jgi:hypothetical protein